MGHRLGRGVARMDVPAVPTPLTLMSRGPRTLGAADDALHGPLRCKWRGQRSFDSRSCRSLAPKADVAKTFAHRSVSVPVRGAAATTASIAAPICATVRFPALPLLMIRLICASVV